MRGGGGVNVRGYDKKNLIRGHYTVVMHVCLFSLVGTFVRD